MCRSIKRLRQPGEDATTEEVTAAALQFVRKISGFRAPSKANEEAFSMAVHDIAESSRRLLESLSVRPSTQRKPQLEGRVEASPAMGTRSVIDMIDELPAPQP